MALDPHPASTAIENEIPTYRAIRPMAVVSLVLGLLALLCFVDPGFLVVAAAAVVAGVLADRKIRRMPEALTGRRLAQAGVALGLTFGLASVTIATVQGYLLKADAVRFGRQYAETLERASVSECVWYRLNPSFR